MNELNTNPKNPLFSSQPQERSLRGYGNNYIKSLNQQLVKPKSVLVNPSKLNKNQKKGQQSQLNLQLLENQKKVLSLDHGIWETNIQLLKLKEQTRVVYRMIQLQEDKYQQKSELIEEFEKANFNFLEERESLTSDVEKIREENDKLVSQIKRLEKIKGTQERLKQIRENVPLNNIVQDIRTLEKVSFFFAFFFKYYQTTILYILFSFVLMKLAQRSSGITKSKPYWSLLAR